MLNKYLAVELFSFGSIFLNRQLLVPRARLLFQPHHQEEGEEEEEEEKEKKSKKIKRSKARRRKKRGRKKKEAEN